MHDLLFDNQLHLKATQLRAYAQRLPIDMARYTAEMDDHVYLQRVREHQPHAVPDRGRHALLFTERRQRLAELPAHDPEHPHLAER